MARTSNEWRVAFTLIRRALALINSDLVQSVAHKIPPEEITRIEDVVADLQEAIVDLERTTEERFYCN